MIRVLFVDDEQPVLDGLRVRMRALRDKWQTQFVLSGQHALELLSTEPFDVIVSDMRMPEMDGARLLRTVSERWPHIVRIVLSGYSEFEQTMRLVPVAHQYLSKPCDLTLLENLIDRCRDLRRFLEQPVLRSVVGQLRQLPPIPETYAALQEAMAVETVSVRDVGQIVARDTVISAKLLQLVNSAFFRLPRRINDIEQAVAYLGLVTVRNLVVSAEVFAKWPETSPSNALNFKTLQTHAVAVAAVTRALTIDSPMASEALLAAMLHDIGYWVLAQEHGAALDEALQLASREHLSLPEAERRVLGASHAEVGAYLLGLWGFPINIVEAVAHHHNPRRVPQTRFDVLAALSIGDALARPLETSALEDATIVHSEIDEEYLRSINAPFDWTEAVRRAASTNCSDGVTTP
jgi:putative nucleotidyltransferase with HDIG domain